MLQVVAVTSTDLTVDSLFGPDNFIDNFVSIDFEHFQGKSILAINNPYKEKSIRL